MAQCALQYNINFIKKYKLIKKEMEMLDALNQYLINITSATRCADLLRCVATLNEAYIDGSFGIDISNFMGQIDEVDSARGLSELQSLVLTRQIQYLAKLGIFLSDVDYSDLDKLSIIIEVISSIEVFEDKESIVNIINNGDDNIDILSSIISEVNNKYLDIDYASILDGVSSKTIDTIADYCQTTTDDIISKPIPDLVRLEKYKKLTNTDNDSNDYYVTQCYIIDGYRIGVSLKSILNVIKHDLLELNDTLVIKNLKACFLLSCDLAENANYIVNEFANEFFPDKPSLLVDISHIDFGSI
jgi:hypothetical protein